MKPFGLLIFSLSFSICSGQTYHTNQFIDELDSLRIQMKIPGMAAGILEGNSVLFEKGFGYADLERKIPATASTSFPVASVTKTFTSTIIMQLVEKGVIRLTDLISKYGVDLGNPSITVGQLLTHTSEGIPGSFFQYNGYRFGRLGPIIESAAQKSFYALLMENIIMPLNMKSSAPALSLDQYYNFIQAQPSSRQFFDTAFSHLARPYERRGDKMVISQNPNEFGAFGGLVTTVRDLLKYSLAIDRHQFVSGETQKKIFTPNRTSSGESTPYGLGWFVQKLDDIEYYWHYGQTPGESALLIKVPARKLTFVAMANSDQLSQPFPLGDGDLFMSPLAQLFYKYYIDSSHTTQSSSNKILITRATIALLNGDSATAHQLYQVYARDNFKEASQIPATDIIASIEQVPVNSELTKSFTLHQSTKVRAYGVGENCSGDRSSWCDFGWIEDVQGKIIWQMPGQPAQHAGGAAKNQRVDTVITLKPGRYKLRYKSDGGHAYNSWDSLPPDFFFWGIVLQREK